MVDFKYDFSFLIKMIKFVFLPVLAIVILTAFIIMIYSKKVKQKDIQRYNYLVEFWTTLLAIMVIGALLAVTIGFSISLSESIKLYNLVEGNEVIYYIVLATPLIPLLFLVIYIYRMIIVLINKPKKQRKIEVEEQEIIPEPSVIEKNTSLVSDDKIDKDTTEGLDTNDEIKGGDEEFVPPLVFSDNIAEVNQSEINTDSGEIPSKNFEKIEEKNVETLDGVDEEENNEEIEVL